MLTDYLLLGAVGFLGAAGRWRARHGVRRDLDHRDAVDGPAARAGERDRAHRRNLHHRRVGRLAYVAPQRRLAAGRAARHRGRGRRGARRMDAVEPRCRLRPAVHRGLSAARRHLHSAESLASRAGARRARAVGRPDRIRGGLPRCERRWRLGAGRDVHAGRLRPYAAHGRRLGQHGRVLRHHCGRDHILRRARRVAVEGIARAGRSAECSRRRSAAGR